MDEPKRMWLVSTKGEAVAAPQQRRQPKKPEDKYQLHAQCRLGLHRLYTLFEAAGFRSRTFDGPAVTDEISFTYRYVTIDVSIRKPGRIAYVTSKPGYQPHFDPVFKTEALRTPFGTIPPQEIYRTTAHVKYLNEEVTTDYVVQVVVNVRGETHNPVYVELPLTLEDPEKFVFWQVLGILSQFADHDLSFKEAFGSLLTSPTECSSQRNRTLENSSGCSGGRQIP